MLVSLQHEHQEEDPFLLPLESFEEFRILIEDNQLDKYGGYPLTKKTDSSLIRIIVTCGKGKNLSKVYELCNHAENSKETTKVFESLVHEFQKLLKIAPSYMIAYRPQEGTALELDKLACPFIYSVPLF